MAIGESRTFKISGRHFNPPAGRQACRITSRLFTVIKQHGVIGQDIFGPVLRTYFYAISGRMEFNERQNGNITHRYQSQVAYIKCQRGWIEMVKVFDASIEPQPLPLDDPRGCGIGVVLTELCLIDPDLNNMDFDNRAKMKLSRSAQMQELVTASCVRLVGLSMAANPIRGANVYFSAAIRMGYGKMIVDQSKQEFNIYETKIARENFDSNTGIIEACCSVGYSCSAFYRDWFFCDEKRSDMFPGNN